jgi:hypothetical protein
VRWDGIQSTSEESFEDAHDGVLAAQHVLSDLVEVCPRNESKSTWERVRVSASVVSS